MNIVTQYMDKHYVLIRNLGGLPRFVGGLYVPPGGYIVMDKGSANTFLNMIHDRNWALEIPFSSIGQLKAIIHSNVVINIITNFRSDRIEDYRTTII